MLEQSKIAVVSNDPKRLDQIIDSLDHHDISPTEHELDAHLVAQLEAQTVHAVLIDYASNPEDAQNACKAIQASPALNNIPVLFVTDHSEHISLKDLFHAGADDILVEPYESEEIQARLSAAIAKNPTEDNVNAICANDTVERIKQQLEEFKLFEKVDRVKKELQENADEMIDIHEDLRNAMQQASDSIAKAEYSLQFTDRIAQQVNEIGKLIYGIQMATKNNGNDEDEQGAQLIQSSSKSVLDELDTESVDDVLKSLDL